MALSLLVALVFTHQRRFDFYAKGPYNPEVPRPEATLGYEIGDKTTTFRDQELALKAIAEKSNKIKVVQYGKSTEGRPLRVFAISSAANIARLDQIKEGMKRVANGEKPANDLPAIVWVNECIHGDETASFESAMPLVYNLAASQNPSIEKELENTVVVVNPVYNPDGHERFTVFYNSIATRSDDPGAFEQQEPSLIYGRLNHYRFDMNRDRVAMSQDETRQEVAEFLRWNPQVYIDQHGQVASYFFPPNPMAVNQNVDRERMAKWTDVFGRATAAAFDKNGWTYFVKDEFDLYYPGYLDSWTSLSGAIGMTHETDGGRVLSAKRPDGSTVTLRDGAEKHFTSALAVIGAASANHTELLASYAEFKHKAVTGDFSRKVQSYVLEADYRTLKQIQARLALSGIQSSIDEFGPRIRKAIPVGKDKEEQLNERAPHLSIPLAQGQGPLAKSLLEQEPGFEEQFVKEQLAKKGKVPEGEDYPGPEDAEFYDVTAWAIPYAFDVKAYWSAEKAHGSGYSGVGPISFVNAVPAFPVPNAIGYALTYENQEDALAVFDALNAGLRGAVTTKPMSLGASTYDRGTFIFSAARNEEGYDKALIDIAKRHGCRLEALGTSYPAEGRQGPGSENVVTLKKPKIGVLFGSGTDATDFGAIWYLMDREFKIPFTPLSNGALNPRILTSYTTIVIPSGSDVSAAPGPLRDWVQAGGCLVVLGNPGWAIGEKGFVKLEESKGERSIPGSIFQANLDPRSFLSYGYATDKDGNIQIAVPVSGTDFYKVRKEGGSIVTFSGEEKVSKFLAGWEWPDETEKALRGTTWLQDVPLGGGHVILFTQDPSDRALWPGLNRLLLNAMLLGPSV